MYCYYKFSLAFPHVPWVGPQCMIVVFPDHTHLLFYVLLSPYLCFIAFLYLNLYVLEDDALVF